MREVAIVGLYVTKQARSLPGRTSLDLIHEAVRGAIADAGLRPSDVDGASVRWPGPGGAPDDGSSNWAPYLNGSLTWTNDAPNDNGGARGVMKAAAAISAGFCTTVVIGSGRAGAWSTDGSPVGAGAGLEFTDPFGAYVMPQFAMVAARHMHEYGTTPEQLALVSATIRNNGHVNPEAVMYGQGPYTVEDVLRSRLISTPLHLLDCSIVAEGAVSIVLTTADRARDLPHPPVLVLGAGMEVRRGGYANPPLLREVGWIGEGAASRALSMAGASATDLDVLSLYDPTSFEIIRQLEMLGLCGRGEGGPMAASGAIARDGRYPVNPDGGLLSHSWLGNGQLTLKVVEGVRQLRGQAANQVPGARLAMVTNAGAGAQHIELLVLGRP